MRILAVILMAPALLAIVVSAGMVLYHVGWFSILIVIGVVGFGIGVSIYDR